MKRHPIVTLAIAAISLLGLFMAGCSDDTVIYTNVSGEPGKPLSEIAKMFPAADGFQTTFSVTQSNGTSEIVTYTVGDEVTFGYSTAYEMKIRSSSGERRTTYFNFSKSALYFYENYSSTPEKVLALPLGNGNSWELGEDDVQDIFVDTYNNTADTTTNQTNDDKGVDDPIDPKPGDEGNGGVMGKAFPGSSSGLCTIEQTETFSLSNGSIMSGSVRVRNDSPGGTNYYWFTPGIGLTRYVLNADQNDIWNGTEVGELIDYGFGL